VKLTHAAHSLECLRANGASEWLSDAVLPLPAADTRLPADVSAATVLLALPAANTMPADVRLPADDSAGTVLLPLKWRCAAGAERAVP
jgi:hypothetical protein